MVRAVDGKIEIPGSSRASDNFFLLFHLPHLRKAKKTPHLRKTESFFGA